MSVDLLQSQGEKSEKKSRKKWQKSREKNREKSREKNLKVRKKSRQKKLSAKFEWHLLGSVNIRAYLLRAEFIPSERDILTQLWFSSKSLNENT